MKLYEPRNSLDNPQATTLLSELSQPRWPTYITTCLVTIGQASGFPTGEDLGLEQSLPPDMLHLHLSWGAPRPRTVGHVMRT